MTEFQIKNIPLINNVDFNFVTPLDLNINKPFADDLFNNKGAIPLKSIKANASKTFPLGKADDKVDFEIGADAFSALGVFRKTNSLIEAFKAEGMSEPIANLLNIKIADDENLLALRWGFGFKAAVDGKVGLTSNPIKITFGVDARKKGLFTLLQKRKRDEKAIDSITNVLKSWRIPRQIESTDNLDPNTTIAMETLGEIKTSIGVQYGYDYSWVREELSLGGLSGDIGVKINASVDAQFGFSALGRYSVALSRENEEEKIRFQVFKLKQNGRTFAFNGGVSGQIDKHPFPKKPDEFIKGIFNLNGSQVIKDFEKWLDPNTKIEDLLGDKLVDEAKKLIGSVTGVDVDQELEKATEKFKELIELWHGLPNQVSSLIYDLLPLDISDLSGFLAEIKGFSGTNAEVSEKITNEIEKHVSDVNFYKTPIGKWLMEIANGEITTLLANIEQERKGFLEIVDKTAKLLDGSEVETRLKKLQEYLDGKLNLDKIKDLTKTDDWLKARLKAFLGKQTLINKDLENIRKAINKLRDKADEFYTKAYNALTKKYGAEINYKFQKTVSSDALIDLTFDFSSGNKASSKSYLKLALDGDFNDLLSKQIKGVTLNKAVLTHSIKRNSNLSITLPYSSTNMKHINESIASNEIVDEADGRLWVFNLGAKDIVEKDDRISKLAINSEFSVQFKGNANIRHFSSESNKINHSSLYTSFKTKRSELEFRYELSVNEYLHSDIGSFSQYLTTLDKTLDGIGIKGDNNFGSVLISLALGLDGRVLQVWKDTPQNYQDEFYKQMSFAVQRRFRDWIPKAYIQEPSKYDDENDIYALLLYMSLPPLSNLDKPRLHKKIDTKVYHWEYYDVDTKMEMFESHCRSKLIDTYLPNVQKVIRDLPIESSKKSKILKKYEASNIEKLKKVMKKQKAGGLFNHRPSSFNRLCKFERDIIERIIETTQCFHEFWDTDNDPQKRLKYLANFGFKFTDTFNNEIGHITFTPKGALRPLGLVLMSDIAKLLQPDLTDVKLSAIFDLYVLDADVKKDKFKTVAKKFLDGEHPESGDLIAIQQRIINKETKLII